MPQPKTPTLGVSSQCHPSQDQSLPNPNVVDITFTVLGQHSNESKYSNDNNYLPTYIEIDPTKGSPYQSIEVAIQIRGRRASNSSHSPLFENIRFTLHGAIKTEIGKHEAIQKIVQASEQRSWSDFASYHDGQCIDEASPAPTFCTTVEFTTNGIRKPSSTVITGSRYVTEHTVLSDQHLVTGRCEVQYWITAEFTAKPNTECLSSMPRVISSPLHLSFRPLSIHIEPSTTPIKPLPRLRFKESCNSIFAYCGYSKYAPHQQANITFNILKTAPIPLIRCRAHDRLTFVIPVTMTITIPLPASAADAMRSTLLRHHLLQKGLGGIVSLTAEWHTSRRFGVGAAAKDHSITTHSPRTISEKLSHDFPPFYVRHSENEEEYTAATYLDLTVPQELISNCSFESNLLRTQYTLNLDLSSRKLKMGSVLLLPACSAMMGVKCSLS